MMNAIVKKGAARHVEPVLRRVLAEAEKEERELQEVFSLMGWESLPGEIKMEIRDDIRGYRDELTGRFSTTDPWVLKRRQRIDYWVRSYSAGLCTLDTAVQALRIRAL